MVSVLLSSVLMDYVGGVFWGSLWQRTPCDRQRV